MLEGRGWRLRSLLMADTYCCCGHPLALTEWLDHAEVEHHFSESLKCLVCGTDLQVPQIRVHVVNEHLISCPHQGCSFVSESFELVQEHVGRDHPTSSRPPPPQEGETSQRIGALLRSNSGVKSVRLARYLVLHKICSEDRGFGCGFRNLQTVISSLLFEPEIRRVCGFTQTPNITQIQVDIERAWREGFDQMGASQLGRRLLGTRKWIGATEVATFLQYHHIRVHVVDIKLHTNRTEMQKRLIDWVKQYYESTATPFPLYFQHEGHSRTIIGVEDKGNKSSLIVYDPNTNPERIQKAINNRSAKGLSFLLFSPSTLTHREYQIVAVRGVLPSDCYNLAKDFTVFNHIVL